MAQTWLLPIDGSETALKAVDWVIANATEFAAPPVVHLLNVQPLLPADIGRFVNHEQIRAFHREQGEAALAPAVARMREGGIDAQPHVSVGDTAETICEFASTKACTQIVMGTHGRTGVIGVLLGSTTIKVAHQAGIPVLLIR